MREVILPYLEWEVLHEPIKIQKVDDIEGAPKGQKMIGIERDEDYRLRAVLSIKCDAEDFARGTARKGGPIPGSFVEPFSISGSDEYGSTHYTLESCYLGSRQTTQTVEGILYKADLNVQGLRIQSKTKAKGVWLIEWYINGPRDSFVFSGSTTRKKSSTFLRERSASKDNKVHSVRIPTESTSISTDFLRINACDIQFLISRVPDGIRPEWSSNIGIEYRDEWGKIPDANERERIGELCSFILGRQLFLVGHTILDKDSYIVEQFACNPWSDNARSLCLEHDVAPTRISVPFLGKAEAIISQLLPQYCELRDSLNLKDALWRYWIARSMPVGTDLPVFAAAVEMIMNGWFASNKTKSRGVYISKDEYEDLLREEISAMRSKLANTPYSDKVIKGIENAYQMRVTDRFRKFFEEIGLDVNENEQMAIEARNKIAHGQILKDTKEARLFVQHSKSYDTLINRILLKLLGYSGSYIDRSHIGWPDKQIA